MALALKYKRLNLLVFRPSKSSSRRNCRQFSQRDGGDRLKLLIPHDRHNNHPRCLGVFSLFQQGAGAGCAPGVGFATLSTIRNPKMPSFDVVSDFDAHEARNGVDQANREVTTRFDFKGTGSKYELEEQVISLTSQSDFQLKQMIDILHLKLSKRGIDIACLEEQEPEFAGNEARQKVILRRSQAGKADQGSQDEGPDGYPG
jgi:hypothetical protein